MNYTISKSSRHYNNNNNIKMFSNHYKWDYIQNIQTQIYSNIAVISQYLSIKSADWYIGQAVVHWALKQRFDLPSFTSVFLSLHSNNRRKSVIPSWLNINKNTQWSCILLQQQQQMLEASSTRLVIIDARFWYLRGFILRVFNQILLTCYVIEKML